MAWDKKLVNLNVTPKGETTNVRKLPGTTSTIVVTAKAGNLIGRTTGAVVKQTDGDWYQVIIPNGGGYGYVRNDVVNLTPAANDITDAQAADLVNKLVANDAKIYESLIRSSVMLKKLKEKNANTATYDQKFKTLYNNVTYRKNKIENSNLLKFQTGLKNTYTGLVFSFKWYLLSTFGINTINAIPVIGYVIAVTVGAGVATLAYFAFKPDYDQSTVDLKISSDLESALSKVDPETAAAIKTDLEGQIDTAYNRGKTDGSFSGMFTVVKYIGIGILGFMVVNSFMKSQNKKNNG